MHTSPPSKNAATSHPAIIGGGLPSTVDNPKAEQTQRATSLLLIEDHQSMIDGMLPRLQVDYDVTVVSSYDAMQAAIAQRKYALAIVDLSLPGHLHGMRMMPALREAGVKFLIFSGTAETWQIRAAIRMSARGYVDKRQGLTVLVQALHEVEAGNLSFPSEIMDRLNATEGQPLPKRFGPGEIAVMNQLFALAEPSSDEVPSSKEIADALNLQVGRVNNIFQQLFTKFDVWEGRKALFKEIKARGYFPGITLE